MKKLLFTVLAFLALSATAYAITVDYYACNAAQAINGNSTWCTAAHRTGSCSGDSNYTAYATITTTDNLHANGCTVTIPEQFTGTFNKISNKTDGTSTDGGGFTATTTGWTHTTTNLIASVETGGTTGAALTISGNGNLNPAFTLGSSGTTVTVTGGSASSMNGVTDSHTAGTVVAYANMTGGSNGSACGYLQSGATGTVAVTGNATGATGEGYRVSGSGTGTINGDCIGSATSRLSPGCNGYGAALTATGYIIAAAGSTGAVGKIIWAPSNAQKYIKFDGGGTAIYAGGGLGSDAGGTQITGANTAAKVATGTYFIKKDDGVYTQGSASSSGGGSWGF